MSLSPDEMSIDTIMSVENVPTILRHSHIPGYTMVTVHSTEALFIS